MARPGVRKQTLNGGCDVTSARTPSRHGNAKCKKLGSVRAGPVSIGRQEIFQRYIESTSALDTTDRRVVATSDVATLGRDRKYAQHHCPPNHTTPARNSSFAVNMWWSTTATFAPKVPSIRIFTTTGSVKAHPTGPTKGRTNRGSS